jgi:hypothetical protein
MRSVKYQRKVCRQFFPELPVISKLKGGGRFLSASRACGLSPRSPCVCLCPPRGEDCYMQRKWEVGSGACFRSIPCVADESFVTRFRSKCGESRYSHGDSWERAVGADNGGWSAGGPFTPIKNKSRPGVRIISAHTFRASWHSGNDLEFHSERTGFESQPRYRLP